MNNSLAIACLLFLSLLASPTAMAKIYTWTDANGKTVFSDQPQVGATEVKLAPPQTWSSADAQTRTPTRAPAPHSANKNKTGSPYRLLTITQPLHDQALRAANGQVDIVLAIEPNLAVSQGHRIRIHLDGKVIINNSKNTRLSLSNINRGSHQLSATINDANGKVISRSEAITFHLHRQSRLHNKPTANP